MWTFDLRLFLASSLEWQQTGRAVVPRGSQVHLAALRLANEVAADAGSAAALALAGLLPSVARFADPRWPDHGVRSETGRFLGALATGPPAAAQLLCACQVRRIAPCGPVVDCAPRRAGTVSMGGGGGRTCNCRVFSIRPAFETARSRTGCFSSTG